MNLKDFLRENLPQGKARDILKSIYHTSKLAKIRLGFDDSFIRYSQKEKMFYLDFKNGMNEASMQFPETQIYYIEEIGTALPGYLMCEGIQNNKIIVDAGAFPGEFSILAAKTKGVEKVFALEPDPENREYLERTVELNGVGNIVEVLPYALSNIEGVEYMGLNGHGSMILKENEMNGFRTIVPVQTITLDKILGERRLLRNGSSIFVKMDIEGSEIKALQGAEKTLDHGAKFAIASYHPIDGVESSYLLEKIFEKADYSFEHVNPIHKTTIAQPR